MGTPYHAKRHSDTSKAVVTAGFTPGGHITSGYSYLQRSHSYKTSARSNVPQGLESPSAAKQLNFSSPSPSPSQNHSTWLLQRSSSTNSLTDGVSSPRLPRQQLDTQLNITDLVAQLPPNPKAWTPSQVALYLTHVLGLTPKPVVQDVTNYVRSSGMGGKVFLRLCEKDLEAEGLNLKWRKLMIEAVKKLRRDCLRGRIWGLEGGLQLPRQDDELEDEPDKGTKDGLKRSSINPMETLKRLRDKKAIKAMIDAFESGQDQGQEEEARSFTSSSRGHRSRGSLSSVHSSDSIEQLSGCAPLSPIYGKGFVKSLAESYTSLNDASPQNSRKDFTREELEHWFGSLSDQEAEALANELHQDEELQQCELEMHHSSGGTRSYSSRSSTSGESEVLVTPAVELKGFDLTPLDANIIEAILGERLETGSINEIQDNDLCVEPLHREDLIDDDTVMFERSQSLNQLRSELLKGAKMNLYRESTYETEDMVALGLLLKDDDDVKHNTARKLDCLLSKEAVPFKGPMDPSQDSMRMKKVSQDTVFAKDIFGSVSLPDKIETLDHMRHMTALEIRGLSPYKSVSPGMSRSSSQRKRGEGERTAVSEAKEGNTMATFGRRGGLANKLQGGESFDECAANKSDDGGKAEDESEWGVTVSRKASRRSTLARATNRDTDKAAARMADLFTPAASIQAELNEVNLKELEAASSSKEHLCVPMTTGELSEDGKSVKRKRSMVLVERKKFEALARRMGVLESQLAQLEAASLPSLSDLGSMSERGRNSHKLDEIFALPAVPQPSRHNVSEQQKGSDDGDGPLKVWSLPMMLSALPSYVIGMSAGLTVVLLREVVGKARR